MTSEQSSNGHGSVSPVGASSGTDTKPLRELVVRTRRLLRSTWVLTGLLASFGLGLLLLVGSTMADFVVSSAAPSDWTWLRTLALVLLVVPTAWAVVVGVLRPLLRRLSNVLVARRIETELPAIHNRLVTCIDLEDEEQRVPVSQAFHRRLVSEALERIREFHPRQVLDIHKLRHASLVAIVGTLALAVIFIPGVTTAMARVFNPFDDIPPAGHASYSVEVGNTDQMRAGNGSVVRGDDIVFQAKLTGGSLYEDERLELAIETVNDKGEAVTIRHTLPAFAALDDAALSRTVLKGLEHDFDYRVSGGGTYTRRFHVQILARPEIVGIKTELAYPEYMEKLPLLSDVADVEGPVGSTVTVNVKAEGDIQEGWVEFLEARSRRVTVADRPARTWFAATRPDGSAPSGTWQEESLAGKAAHTDPANSAVHAHGFTGAAEPFQVGTDEVLFVDVYLPPDQVPREIMLKWHDGQGWEHRAFWGEDLVSEGKPGTASRYHIGPIPQSGRLVRLEVPAALVGLAGRTINGMMFTLHGGQAVWGSAGTLPPGEEIRTELFAIKDMKFKLQATPVEGLKKGQKHLSGTFPLLDNGLYRVQLKNDASRFNKQMAEARIVAIPDSPPQVIIERPRQTLVLSQPQPVPISITSFDDFGIKDIVLSVRIDDQETFAGEPVVALSPPLQNDHRDVILDLSQRGLKVGGTLTYRVEVRDGKGQSGQTVDYVIQIKDDKAAEDKQFEQLEKETDTFRDKFIELVAQQKKVQTKSQELEKKYKKLTEKIEKAQDEAAKEQADKKDPADEKAKKDAKKEKKKDAKEDPDQPKPVELSPEEQKELDALKKEIAELVAQETKNVALAEQVKTDLKTLAEKAEKNQLVPQQVTEQMKQIEKAFEKAAIDPLKNLVQQMQQATQPKQQDTALPEINKQAERVQKDLEALKKRMDSLARAQRDSRQDLKQAMKDLKKDLLEQNADLTRDALKDLKDYLEAMEKDLKAVMGKQENLLKDSQANLSSEDLKKALQAEQEKLSRDVEKKLDKTAKLLDAKRMPRQPFFPGRPYKPEDEAYKVPPKEQDSDPEPEDKKAKKEKDAKDKKKKKKKGDKEEPEEDFFLPALGGLRAELDPRFEKMIRQMKKKLEQQKKGEKGDPEQQERNRQQAQRLQELDLAQKALQSDQKSLEQLQQELQQAQQKSQQQQQPQQQQSLEQLMQKALMQKAQKMMKRLQQQGQTPQQQQQQQQQPPEPTLANQLLGNLKPDGQGTEEVLVELNKVDVTTRRVIMKMQPKEREELLQGLREEGPKAYQGFIRDYFKKLSRARAAKPGK